MYNVCRKMYSRAGHEARQQASQSLSPILFFHSFLSFFFLGEEKKIMIRRNILKTEKKKVPVRIQISLFFLS